MCENRSADEWRMDRRSVKTETLGRPFLLTLLLGTTILLAACGQVVTPQPTGVSLPIDTPTATAVTPVQRATTRSPSGVQLDAVTPTVTATPVVHVVQQGDTLQAIAFDFGVSVEALQRVNAIENPQFLQVGQRLVIPFDEESGQTSPGLLLPTPTPHPIQVQGVAFYETPVDSLLGLGEVVNTTAITLTNVEVQVTLLNDASEPLVDTNTFISIDLLPAGARSPFNALFTTPPPDWASYQVSVIRGQEAGALATAYVPMSVLEAEGAPKGPQFQVTGTIVNTSTERTAESVDVFVTTYAADGTVTGFRRSTLTPALIDGGLSPGGETAFSLLLTTHGGMPDDFVVSALGHAAKGTTSGG